MMTLVLRGGGAAAVANGRESLCGDGEEIVRTTSGKQSAGSCDGR